MGKSPQDFNFDTKNITQGLRACRELGASLNGNLGLSEDYDEVMVPFFSWAGTIGQYQKFIDAHPDSHHFRFWKNQHKKLIENFILRYEEYFVFRKTKTPYLPQKWMTEFYAQICERRSILT